MSDEAAAPSLGDQIVAALKDSPHPLKLAELVKKLPKAPKKTKADAWKDLLSALSVLVRPAHRETAKRLVEALAEVPAQQAA